MNIGKFKKLKLPPSNNLSSAPSAIQVGTTQQTNSYCSRFKKNIIKYTLLMFSFIHGLVQYVSKLRMNTWFKLFLFISFAYEFLFMWQRLAKEEKECVKIKKKSLFITIKCDGVTPIRISLKVLENVATQLIGLIGKSIEEFFGGYNRTFKFIFIYVLIQVAESLFSMTFGFKISSFFFEKILNLFNFLSNK